MRQSNINVVPGVRRPLTLAAAAAVTAAFGLSATAQAQSTWTGATSQDWNDSSNWSNNFPAGVNAIVNTATGNYPILNTNSIGTPVDIFIGNVPGSPGRFDQTAGELATGNGNWYFVGSRGGTGTYNLANTAVTGTGISGFGQGSGSLTAGRFWVGGADFNDNGTGVVNINTTGTLTATEGPAGIIVGQAYGANGFTDATVNLESGTVVSNNETFIGRSGKGVWNQSGGTFTSRGYLGIGREFAGKDGGFFDGDGTINLTGGTINSSTNFGFTTLGGGTGSTGRLNVGGTGVYDASFVTEAATANGGIVLGEAWQGPNTAVATGILTVSGGGEVRLGTNAIQLGTNAQGNGTINLDGGTITAARIYKGAGVGNVYLNGGTLRPSATNDTNFLVGMTSTQVRNGGGIVDTNGFDATIGDALVHSQISGDNAIDGGITKTGIGTLTLTGVNGYTGRTTVKAGTLALTYSAELANSSGPVLTGGGADIQGGRLVLNYAGSTSPSTAVKGLIASSRNANYASGNFISTGIAAGRGLGYADDGVGQVTIALVINGDADLSGAVSFADFVALQSNFGQTGVTYAQGDFDYNNTVNFADFVILQSSFGQSLAGGRAEFTREQYAAVMSIGNASEVPEPAALAAVAAGGLVLARRRRTAAVD